MSQISSVQHREMLSKPSRWVVKIGSAVLTDDGRGVDRKAIASWVSDIVELRKAGYEIVIVSSGSVAEGLVRLGFEERPTKVYELQAAASVGQMGLVQAYEAAFQAHNVHTGQILLTHDDLADRKRYLNARNTLQSLLSMGAVPIINENDTVVTKEIRFGDNDTLGALVANLIDAALLVILTDQDGMYTADPRTNPEATLIDVMPAQDESLYQMAGDSKGRLGRGGMSTKVSAANLAALSGASTLIVGGRHHGILTQAASGESVGTLLYANDEPSAARKNWISGHLQVCGDLMLDAGAVKALVGGGSSLLPVGVLSIRGAFSRGDLVRCVDQQGIELARGLVNYSAQDALRIIGKSSDDIIEILGFNNDDELIHRDNLVLS